MKTIQYVAVDQKDTAMTALATASPDTHALVRGAVELLRAPLGRFVARRLRRQYGYQWKEHALGALHTVPAYGRSRREDLDQDVSALLQIVARLWTPAFSSGSPRFARQYFDEVREFRNALAHGARFDVSDAFRAIDTVHRLLVLIEASEQLSSAQARAQALQTWSSEPLRGSRVL